MTPRNLEASVRDRLAATAKATHRPFQEVLQYYAIERFLVPARDVVPPEALRSQGRAHAARLGRARRPTRTSTSSPAGQLVDTIADIPRVCISTSLPTGHLRPDGRLRAHQGGRRLRGSARALPRAPRLAARANAAGHRVRRQRRHAAGRGDYPTLLDLPAPRLRGYPRETVVAEKFEAMVKLGTLNSRMKDFFDLWLLARRFDFDGDVLAKQVRATFTNRGTALEPTPVALTRTFTDPGQKMWTAFVKKNSLGEIPAKFSDVTDALAVFLQPLATACAEGHAFHQRWKAPGPWRPWCGAMT